MNNDYPKRRLDWPVIWTALVLLLLSFIFYLVTLAPGLTWAHFGADGGELIAAAMVNGVPHPPGYPLYIMLLRGWLMLGRLISPAVDLAWLGNLFSALCAALSVGITTLVGASVLRSVNSESVNSDIVPVSPPVWMWAGVIGVAWATAPLLWKQAIITEVYALHALLIALLGWALLVQRGRILLLTLPVAFGLAHHLTFVLLLPGLLYWLWHIEQNGSSQAGLEQKTAERSWFNNLIRAGLKLVPALIIGLLLYIRIPVAAGGNPPINWGYPDNWDGFWWLTSAVAYRDYLFGVPASSIFDRIAAWAYNLTSQFTAVGLGFALFGLSKWDQERPALRNLGLLWLLPVSIYAISYYTRDSTIYLLPCMWLLALWFGAGLSAGLEFLGSIGQPTGDLGDFEKMAAMDNVGVLVKVGIWVRRLPKFAIPAIVLFGLIGLALVRLPEISLHNDSEARTFVDEVESMLPSDSIIISSADAETFALWYGLWGSQQLVDDEAGPFLINAALLQFPWYQRLVKEQYAELPGAGVDIPTLIRENQDRRPIFFSEEEQIFVSRESLEPVGPLWRYRTNQ